MSDRIVAPRDHDRAHRVRGGGEPGAYDLLDKPALAPNGNLAPVKHYKDLGTLSGPDALKPCVSKKETNKWLHQHAPTRLPRSLVTSGFGADHRHPTGPKISEVTGGSTLDVSCYLFDETDKPTVESNRVTRKRRLCDKTQEEGFGVVKYNGGTLRYAVSPQAAAGSSGKRRSRR